METDHNVRVPTAATSEAPQLEVADYTEGGGADARQGAKWPFGLMGWVTYRTPDGNRCIIVPGFFPASACGPACGYGSVYSLLHDEPPMCYGPWNMWVSKWGCGNMGCLCCLLYTGLLNNFLYCPPNLSPCICLLNHLQRKQLKRKYGIDGSTPADSLWCQDREEWIAALCVPCSSIQMSEFARLKRRELYLVKEAGQPVAGDLPKGYDSMSTVQVMQR